MYIGKGVNNLQREQYLAIASFQGHSHHQFWSLAVCKLQVIKNWCWEYCPEHNASI